MQCKWGRIELKSNDKTQFHNDKTIVDFHLYKYFSYNLNKKELRKVFDK